MKLLLTSAGINNASLAKSLERLVGKNRSATKIGFIPTAANVEKGSKDWFINQLTDLQKFGFTWIDVVDISAPEVDWQNRLEFVDVVYVGGGNTFHLLDQMRKTGFDQWLRENISSKVYVGGSAGAIVVTPSIAIASIDNGDENLLNMTNLEGLGFVNFELSPHTPEHVSHEANKAYLQTITNELYAMDNETAVQVIDENIEFISEGEWKKY